MERTVHMFETFLWTFQDEWFILSNLLLTEQSSEPFNFKLHQLRAEPWCKVLSHSSFLSVEFGAIVSGTWNQPAYKNQTELQKHVVFSTNKKYNPTDWRFWCYRNCSHSCSSFVRSVSETSVLGSRPANLRNWTGSSNCVESFKQWATYFFFPSFLPLLSYLFLFFPLGKGLKPV